jgi:hypothetical protein
MAYEPEQIAADTLTHINFAFALISSTFEVIEMTKGDSDLWRRTTALKEGRPALKVFLSIGTHWVFIDLQCTHSHTLLVHQVAGHLTISRLKIYFLIWLARPQTQMRSLNPSCLSWKHMRLMV